MQGSRRGPGSLLFTVRVLAVHTLTSKALQLQCPGSCSNRHVRRVGALQITGTGRGLAEANLPTALSQPTIEN